MPVVYFLNTLRPEASPEAYERWVRDVDYPTARSLPQITSYVVTRATGTLEGDASPYDYVERVEITDLGDYQAMLASPAMEAFAAEWSSFVGESIGLVGEEIA